MSVEPISIVQPTGATTAPTGELLVGKIVCEKPLNKLKAKNSEISISLLIEKVDRFVSVKFIISCQEFIIYKPLF